MTKFIANCAEKLGESAFGVKGFTGSCLIVTLSGVFHACFIAVLSLAKKETCLQTLQLKSFPSIHLIM